MSFNSMAPTLTSICRSRSREAAACNSGEFSQENSKRRERVRQRRLAAVLHLPGRRGVAHQSVTSRGLSSRWRSLRRGPRFNEVAITGCKPLEEGRTRIWLKDGFTTYGGRWRQQTDAKAATTRGGV